METDPCRRLRIVVADDHELVRRGIIETIRCNPDWVVIGEARNGQEAIDTCRTECPDVVVLDLHMPGISGLDALRGLRETCPDLEVVILSMETSDEAIDEALAAGAKAYVFKSDAARDLSRAIEAVIAGKLFFTGRINERLLASFRSSPTPPAAALSIPLTARERQILRGVAAGRSSKEIAEALGISVRTVETHRRNILDKLGLHGAVDLALYAIRTGLYVPPRNEDEKT